MLLILARICLAHICLTTKSYIGHSYMLLISKITIDEEMLYSLVRCVLGWGKGGRSWPLHRQLSREG